MSKNRPDAGTFDIPIQRAIFGRGLSVPYLNPRPPGWRAERQKASERHQKKCPGWVWGPAGASMASDETVVGFDLSSAAGGPALWGWAILHKAVTPIEIDMLYALIAAAHRTGTRVPLPRCLRSVRPGRITPVDVWVDIGLCIRRHHPEG